MLEKITNFPWKLVLLHSVVLILCSCPGLVTFVALWEALPEEVRIAILASSWLMTVIYLVSVIRLKHAHVILVLTIIQCASPICGFGGKAIFNTTLLFGPGMSVALNLIGVLSSLICLVGLYLQEKLMVIKVVLLPVFQTLEDLNKSTSSFQSLMAEIFKRTASMFASIISLLPPADKVVDWMTADPLNIGKMLKNQVTKACNNTANMYKENCPKWLGDACKKEASFIFSLFNACKALVDSACETIIPNVTQFCTMPDFDANKIGHQVVNIRSALNQISQAIDTGNSTAILGVIDGRLPDLEMKILMALPYVKMSLWIIFGIFMATTIFNKFRIACRLAHRYYTDLGLENDYLNLRWVRRHRPEVLPLTKRETALFQESAIGFFGGTVRSLLLNPKTLVKNLSLVLIVLTVVSANLALSKIQEFTQRFNNITAPIEGKADFQFNVQGTSTLAWLLRLVLQGFNVISSDCDVADSSSCISVHRPLDDGSMFLLWTLAIFYCFSDRIKKRQHYILCRFCDFLCPRQAARRAEYLTDYIERKRSDVGTLVEDLLKSFQNLDKKTKKALTCGMTPDEQGQAVSEFYQDWASKLKWMPMLVSNWILRRNYGLWNLNCQVCWTQVVKVQCQCALMCEECASFIQNENRFCSLCQTDANVLL